jgi:hypothetical protein
MPNSRRRTAKMICMWMVAIAAIISAAATACTALGS